MELLNGTNHTVIFNAPYSPELNPIEMVFGIWKSRIERELREWESLENLLEQIKNGFETLQRHEVKRCIEHVRQVVWPSAFERNDL